MVLARYCVERYASRWERLANAPLAAVSERGVVLACDVFAKARPLLHAQDAAYGTSCGTYGSADNRPEGSSRSFACGCSLFGSPNRSLCVRCEGLTTDH